MGKNRGYNFAGEKARFTVGWECGKFVVVEASGATRKPPSVRDQSQKSICGVRILPQTSPLQDLSRIHSIALSADCDVVGRRIHDAVRL